MTDRLRLLPGADVAALGAHCYLFDRAALHENVVSVPTQRVSQRMLELVRRIRTAWPDHAPQPYAAFAALCTSTAEQRLLGQLAQAGYLESLPVPAPATAGRAAGDAGHADDTLTHFRERVLKHFFKRAAFFHLPEQIDDDDCDVALVGVPVSSTALSSGTVDAPGRLRRDSQRAGFWFDFHADGVYTETGCDDTPPRVICAGTRVKDFGDIGGSARTVGALFAELAGFIDTRLVPHGVRPLFVGGDHAVTFPLVDACLRHHPDLVLVHLDAHNDLFYTERVEFNHAGPVHALLAHSGLGKVLSFGLRTIGDARVAPYKRMQASGTLHERVHLHALDATQRRLADSDAFRAHLHKHIGTRPVYLTIDLDVLSADAIAGQLSTPAGPGLAWHELLALVRLVCGAFDVVACDVVEFNPDHKDRASVDERAPVVLLLELIDGLAQAARRGAAR
ncbi:MAG: arginase family protein [Gammaproteobacteria bacterium]